MRRKNFSRRSSSLTLCLLSREWRVEWSHEWRVLSCLVVVTGVESGVESPGLSCSCHGSGEWSGESWLDNLRNIKGLNNKHALRPRLSGFFKRVFSGFYRCGPHKREKIGYINCEIRIDLAWFFKLFANPTNTWRFAIGFFFI
ncbi:hypothetical protein YC2023_116431 [Brassica napus]